VTRICEAFTTGRFDALAARFKREVAEDDFRLEAVSAVLGWCAGERILDLGCGKGRFGRRLAARGAQVVGLDASQGMLAEACGIERVRGSARRLPFRGGIFHGVMAVELFEHLPPAAWNQVLGEIARVLIPGGAVAIIDKNAHSSDPERPYLPACWVKRLDELRGRFMYAPGDPFRERWLWPAAFTRRLGRLFEGATHRYLLSPRERGRFPFAVIPSSRRYVLWSARRPGGGR